jgi:hypothetical protein
MFHPAYSWACALISAGRKVETKEISRMTRNALAFALVVGTCSLAGALPQNSAQNSAQSSAQNATSNAFQAKLVGLVGEWRGTIEVTWAPGDTTTTELDVSVKANKEGGVLFGYDSFARGRAVNGVTNWTVNANQIACSTYDQRNDWACTFTGALPSTTQGTFSGSVADVTYTQNIKFRDDGSVVIECFKAGSNNNQELVSRMTLTRLPSDKISSANAYLEDAKLLAKVNVRGTQTAGVNGNQ